MHDVGHTLPASTFERSASRQSPHATDWVAALWYGATVVCGSVLIVAAALFQPYNQNEILQITPYGSSDPDVITSGTRQPFLDPLLGGVVQHVLGEGQLQQRLVSVLAGIGTLIVFALLFRRMKLGYTGALALSVLALQPLMVQFSAYARPYALPVFLSVLFVFAAYRSMEGTRGRVGWLALAIIAACALPMTRVPEPNTFLVTAALALAWLSFRGRLSWQQTWPLIACALASVAFIGYPIYRSLESTGLFDPSVSGVADRFGSGVEEIVTRQLPWFAGWFPWWPLTLAVIATTLILPAPRRRLLVEWGWAWWPLLLGPLAFFIAYHFMNPVSFDARPYRDRYAYFFLPAFTLVIAALSATIPRAKEASRPVRIAICALVVAEMLGQIPATVGALTEKTSPDFVGAAAELADEVPEDAVVAYVVPIRLDRRFRQDFMLLQVDTSTTPPILDSRIVASRPKVALTTGPVYVVALDGECANSIYCDKPTAPWDGQVAGWQPVSNYDRFTLFRGTEGQTGRAGLIDAYESFGDAFGPEYGMNEILAASALMAASGDNADARQFMRDHYAQLDPESQERFHKAAYKHDLYPFD